MLGERTVLITGFEPFAGRTRNNSFEIAKRLKAEPGLLGAHVEICELPVVYDRAAQVALEYFESLPRRPDFVVSMGEADAEILLETQAANLDDSSMPDNAGELRRERVIDSKLPERIALVEPDDKVPVNRSTSAGNYVCNNTAFRLAHSFGEKGVPFGFVHVPREEKSGALTPELVARVGKLLGALVQKERSS
jgi:pyroglutamyl-peptidase